MIRRLSLFVVVMSFVGSLYLSYIKPAAALWWCEGTVNGGTTTYKCVDTHPPAGQVYNTLRECLRGADFVHDEITDPAINPCVDDPRFIMRNFAALNFWSVGKGLSLAVPLAIALGAGVCLLYLLYGAYMYITSNGEEKKLADAMHAMTYAGLGLIVIVIAYAIVRTLLFVTKINTFGF